MQLSNRITADTGGRQRRGGRFSYAGGGGPPRPRSQGRAVGKPDDWRDDIRTIPRFWGRDSISGGLGRDIRGVCVGSRTTEFARGGGRTEVQARTGVPSGPDGTCLIHAAGGQAALFAAPLWAVLIPGRHKRCSSDPYTQHIPHDRSAGGVPKTVVSRSEDGFSRRENTLEVGR